MKTNLQKMLAAKINALTKERDTARSELAELRQRIHDGSVWSTENPRLTPRAQAALALAHKEAVDGGQTYVGTEHLLLGMLRQQEGIAARHFIAAGMTHEKVSYALRVGRVS